MVYPGKKKQRSNYPQQLPAYPRPCLLAMQSTAAQSWLLVRRGLFFPCNRWYRENSIQVMPVVGLGVPKAKSCTARFDRVLLSAVEGLTANGIIL